MYLCRASHTAGQFEGTLVGGLIQDCDMGDSLAAHVMLAVMWAALANTVPAAFWAIAFLLQPENAEHKRRALASLCPEPDTATCIEVRYDPGAAYTCTIYACYIVMYLAILMQSALQRHTCTCRVADAVHVLTTSCRTGWTRAHSLP